MPVDDSFQPMYLTSDNDISLYAGASALTDSDILGKIARASTTIDTYCLRQDAEGYGSLVLSTYTERVLIKGQNPNTFRLSQRPLFGIDATTKSALAASACWDNGAEVSLGERLNGNGDLCAIISISGRYGRARAGGIDSWMATNIIQSAADLSTLYGGPPTWVAIDPLKCDYNPRTGEVWMPTGVFLSQFSEVEVTYTAGFDPRAMPRAVRQACGNIIRNLRVRPTPGIKQQSFTDAALNMTFADGGYIDPDTQALLLPFRSVGMG